MRFFSCTKELQITRIIVCILFGLFPIIVYSQAPVANFSVDKVEGCGVTVVTFTDLSTNNPDSLIWDFGGGKIASPNISPDRKYSNVYTTPGIYPVTLRAFNNSGSDAETKIALITIHPNPTVNYSINPANACAGSPVQFNDLSTSDVPITNWQWNFGDGNFSPLQNPTHSYANSNTYNVTLSVTNANGCQSFLTKPSSMVVNPNVTANLSAVQTESCLNPFTANFSSAGSVGPITTYLWNFGDGQTSTDANPSHVYAASGDFTVTLTVTAASGCSNTMTRANYMHINTFNAGISSVDNSVCAGVPVSFTDASSSTATSWVWDFGDGFTSASKNPTHSYAVDGTYTVTLTSSNAVGCSKVATQTNYVTVYPLPVVTFSVDDDNSCSAPFTPQFTNTNTATSWLWNFGDGFTSNLQSPTHTFNSIGTFNVSLQVTDANSCVGTLTQNSFIKIQRPLSGFMSDKQRGCGPLAVSFADTSTYVNPPSSWLWNFGNGQTSTQQHPNYTYPADTGKYVVTLTITDAEGCVSTQSTAPYIYVGMKPTADFSADDSSVCYRSFVEFTDLSEDYVDTWAWQFGDGGSDIVEDPLYSYAVDTAEVNFFDVQLISGHYGCYDTIIKPDFIQVLLPIARYTINPSPLCTFPDSVEFLNDAVGAFTYEWDFGDGETLYVEGDTLTWSSGLIDTIPGFSNPKYLYSATGTYITELKVTNPNGCKDSVSVNLDVSQVMAGFIMDTAFTCQNNSITFTDTSKTDLGRNSASWQWDFGDGTPILLGVQNPVHQYTADGTYTVELIVTNNLGCSDTATLAAGVTIYELPDAQFTGDVTNGCAPFSVNFSEASTFAATEVIDSWNWNFGDGNVLIIQNNLDGTYKWTYNGVVTANNSNSKDPNHVYALRGIYTVILTVTDSKSCTHTLTRTNYITARKPYPGFTVAPITCHYNQVVFTNTSTGQTVNEWNFRDGSPLSNTLSPTHKYNIAQDTTINVLLRVIDNSSLPACDSSLTIPIQVIRPNADFIALHPIIPCYTQEADTIVNSSSSLTGTITNYFWTFEDSLNPFNNTSIIEEPVYLYSGPGVYDIDLRIVDSYGCQDTLSRKDYVTAGGPAGTMVFNPTIACAPEDITFKATAVNATKYHWIYDNGNELRNQTVDSIVFTYEDGRVYNPVLVLEDDNGCLSEPIFGPENLIIYSAEPDFIADIEFSCQDTLVTFTDLTDASDVVSTWAWSFGDLDSAFVQNPTHFYDQGQFDVSLTVNVGICEYSVTKPLYINIFEKPEANFSVSKNPAYMLETLLFTNLTDTLSSPISWIWSVEEGMEDTAKNQEHFYIDHGTYPVMLQAYTHPSCIDTAIVDVIIEDKVYVPNAFTPDDDGINDVYLGGMNLDLIIINRWGDTLYTGKDGWDGTHNGNEVSAGTYFYIITLPNTDVLKGPVTLIR